MEFCDSCGILLPAPSKDAVPYCKPCKALNQSSGAAAADEQKTEEKNVERQSSNEENGTHQQNKEGGPRDNLVAESVREQWEREQTDYKRQLVVQDTSDITALVSGQRRKGDGSRFYIGGVDISFIKGDDVNACACLTVVQMPNLEMVYQRMEMIELTQPYIPGFLAFREVPPLQELFNHLLKNAPHYHPDVILVDGNGKLHPRAFGLACQLGVILDIPTAGVAKTLMSAQGITDDSNHKQKKRNLSEAGDGFDLISDSGDVLGRCVRVHDKAPNPVYISVGHKITLDSAVWITLECSKFRIPEPLRRADLDSREYLRQGKTEPDEFIKDTEVN